MPASGLRVKCEIASSVYTGSVKHASLRRGAVAGALSVALLLVAAFPSRLSVAIKGWGSVGARAVRAASGTLLDLTAVIWWLLPLLVALTCLAPLLFKRLRTPFWQTMGGAVIAWPFGFALWVLTITAQEVKSERGSFPTMFDLLEGGTNASFLEGTLGFIRYERIWLPGAVGALLALIVTTVLWRQPRRPVEPWRAWGLGVVLGAIASAAVLSGVMAGLSVSANRFSAAALGDPLTGLVESTIDLARHRGPATPRELVLDAELPEGSAAVGAQRLGWPARGTPGPKAWARPLDFEQEPPTADPRGRALLEAMRDVSRALFDPADPRVAVFQFSLEGFRADDVHALQPLAPEGIAPYTSGLYAHRPGVVTASHLYQAGVRTAHCLGAMTCGLGTLPYNLSFIRDLQPFPVRCASDVLAQAGFAHSFFYGSDAHFDEMRQYFSAHGYGRLRTQAELPTSLPRGTWDGITDFAVFDAALDETAAALEQGTPQFALVMSLSNHSPFTPPADLPDAVRERVKTALASTPNRADADDALRLATYSYTDAALERFMARLDEKGLSERSVVLVMADHSTGHNYIWGTEPYETDDAKSRIPFAIIIPPQFLARAVDRPALEAALARVQRLINEAPLSQNDVPSLLLALLSAHPGLAALPTDARWHTLGGQVTSPYFQPGGDPASYVLGVNGVSELFALDRTGERAGGYEDSVFLKTRADRYRVTPRLIPITATLQTVIDPAK